MANIEVRWEFEAFDAPITHTATTFRLGNSSDSNTQIVFTGSGFTYDGDGLPTGGTITQIRLVVKDGASDIVMQRLTSVDIGLGAVGDLMRDYFALRAQITWSDVISDDVNVVSFTSTKLRIANTDGTFTDILGTGLSADTPGMSGNVTKIRHIASNGTIILNINFTGTFLEAVSAINEDTASNALFLLINAGDNVLTGISNPVDVGGDTYSTALEDGPGDDAINAGPVSSLDFEYLNAAVTVNLNTDVTSSADGSDTLSGVIQMVAGTAFDDTLTGDGRANTLVGRLGDDTLAGAGGNDVLEGRLGDDVLNGGAGVDTAYFDDDDDQSSGVTVSLAIAGAQNTRAGLDTLISIESLVGTDFGDTLTGNNGGNHLGGRGGNDTLSGGGGLDVITGGEGRDTLTGGGGVDRFVLDAPGAANRDTITDFAVGIDTVELKNSVFTALGNAGTLTAERFWIGANAHDLSDRIIYNASTGALFYDADGSGAGAKVQIAALSTGLALTNADFSVI